MLFLNRTFYKLIILYCFVITCFTSTMSNTPIIEHGYIDRMHPAVILLEVSQEEWVIADEKMPKNSKEGMWVDVDVYAHEVLAINEEKTKKERRKIQQLQEKLRKNTKF